jgi:hypothetical protein
VPPAEQAARALVNRGILKEEQGDLKGAKGRPSPPSNFARGPEKVPGRGLALTRAHCRARVLVPSPGRRQELARSAA